MLRFYLFLCLIVFPLSATDPRIVHRAAPPLLSFGELLELAGDPEPSGPLGVKFRTLLYTPFISNGAYYAGAQPHRPVRPGLGPLLRACLWNIERGKEFELIRLAYSDSDGFLAAATSRRKEPMADVEQVDMQLELLQTSDVLILNEVDLGMTRTGYRDVAAELAAALRMNYAYGVEFIEVDALDLGRETIEIEDASLRQKWDRITAPDPERYRGLHGTAVLSRYPVIEAEVFRFEPCYDWYGQEKAAITHMEKGRRFGAERLFLERIGREVRHGNRMALIVRLAVPESPTGAVTVVAPHLENKTRPPCRVRQMRQLLMHIAAVQDPVILAGDLNTTGTDAAPMSITREIHKRITDPAFWVDQALRWATPVNLPQIFLMPANFFKNHRDPTAWHIPLLAPNREANLFRMLSRFRFSDDYAFDFRGDIERTMDGRERTLGNSNQRALKGFRPTFSFQRDFLGVVGRYKLDWFLIKPVVDPAGRELFSPHFPVTAQELNDALPGGISDHYPLTVDLPMIEERAVPKRKRLAAPPRPKPQSETKTASGSRLQVQVDPTP